jgi:hypothetical protein
VPGDTFAQPLAGNGRLAPTSVLRLLSRTSQYNQTHPHTLSLSLLPPSPSSSFLLQLLIFQSLILSWGWLIFTAKYTVPLHSSVYELPICLNNQLACLSINWKTDIMKQHDILCKTSLRIHSTLNRQLYGRKVLYVQQDLQYTAFSSHHTLTLIRSVHWSFSASGNIQNSQAANLTGLSKSCFLSYINGSKMAAQDGT